MVVTPIDCRATILVKALPQPSRKYGETVCCAGVTPDGFWKRLYPIRYRHLSGETAFSRWDIVRFRYRPPRQDKRAESCNVEENSIEIVGEMPRKERSRLLDPLILPSVGAAARRGDSLALIRPIDTRFFHRRKTAAALGEERAAYSEPRARDCSSTRSLRRYNRHLTNLSSAFEMGRPSTRIPMATGKLMLCSIMGAGVGRRRLKSLNGWTTSSMWNIPQMEWLSL
jgi:hypothetical protein